MDLFKLSLIFVIVNSFFIFYFDKIKLLHYVIDKPDSSRKFHSKPTPLAGGIILIINIFLFYLIKIIFYDVLDSKIFFKSFFDLNIFLLSCFLIFTLGFIDDKSNLNPLIKFFSTMLIIGLFLCLDPSLKIKIIKFSFFDKEIILGNYSFIFTLFCFLVFLNSFNMFDGINLQSSSYALIIITYFLLITPIVLFLIMLLIFLITFIYLNFKDKSFFGDSGTLLISFIISYIFIKLFNEKIILNSDTILIFMLIPGIDMIRLFFERIKNKKNPLTYDRAHLHHLLIKKFSLFHTNFIIIILVTAPLILGFTNLNKVIIITLTILVYSITIFYLRK